MHLGRRARPRLHRLTTAPRVGRLRELDLAAEVRERLDDLGKNAHARCGNSGYRGRIGIFQLLEVTQRPEQLAAAKVSREEIERAALAEGTNSLWVDGVAKVAACSPRSKRSPASAPSDDGADGTGGYASSISQPRYVNDSTTSAKNAAASSRRANV